MHTATALVARGSAYVKLQLIATGLLTHDGYF